MTTLETILRRIQTELDGQRKKWSVVGGLAVVVRGEPRFTRDADLADLRSLIARASIDDIQEAEGLLSLIT